LKGLPSMAKQSATAFDLLVFLVIGISLSSLGLLALNRFSPWYALIIGVLIVFLLLTCWRVRIDLSLRGVPIALILILLGALIFRLPPYLYVAGGQDQGTYVNMAGTYLKKGSTFIVDDVREKAIASGLKDLYDASNQKGWHPIKKGEYEGVHLPGIYIKDTERSTYVYQFYPLHPLWMAMAGKFLGEQRVVYSLVFFSLLSIAAFYYLALAFSGGHALPAVLVAALLAVNPLHAFFSKFPVTEVAALAFSSLGFLYLLWYWQCAKSGSIRPFYLVLSAGLFGCLFFTRITGFLYMPFFYLIFLLSLLFERDLRRRSQLGWYALSVMLLYALSILYGLFYSYPYSHDIYKAVFSVAFHSGADRKLGFPAGLGVGILLFVWFFRGKGAALLERHVTLRKVGENAYWILWAILMLVFLFALRKTYAIAFTDIYAGLQDVPGGRGWESLQHASIFVAMLYLSPIGFGIFVYGILRFFPRQKEPPWAFFVFFLACFYFSQTVIMFYLPHQYYYGRYLVSEVVPFSLLAVCLVLGAWYRKGRWGKGWAIGLSLAMGVYFLYFTSHQFGKSAGEVYSPLKEVQETMQKEDLLLLVRMEPPWNWLIQTPLSLFFNLNTFNLKLMPDLETIQGKQLMLQFGDLFVLSKHRLQIPFVDFIKEIPYAAGDFEKSRGIPTRYHPFQTNLYLHKANKPMLTRKIIYPEEKQGDLVNFHEAKWTNGEGIIKNIHTPLDPEDRFVILHTRGQNPFLKDHTWPAPEVYINGTRQAFYSTRKHAYTYSIQGDPEVIQGIRIVSPFFVPNELGISEDSRKLGVDIASIVIKDRCDDNIIYPYRMVGDLVNFHGTEFTNGNGIIQNIDYLLRPSDRFVILHTYGWNPFLKNQKWPAPELYINGISQRFDAKVGDAYTYDIEGSPEIINDIRIVSPTFVPKEVGINEDPRKLGVDVHSIEISDTPPDGMRREPVPESSRTSKPQP